MSSGSIRAQPSLPWARPVRRGRVETLQLNLGRYCNIACTHCHVDSGPMRKELMSPGVRARVVEWIRRHRPAVVDLTGGAPELIPGFRELVAAAREAGCAVMVRCNLVSLDEPGQEDLVDFLAAMQATVVASMPCYLEENVDKQRGRGTYARSIAGLRRLNAAGYGGSDALPLYLVYNPGGASLPPDQGALERDYRLRLGTDWGIVFTALWCLCNVPINRFQKQLEREGALQRYEDVLREAFNPATLELLMCRSTLSVDHEGRLFDCDFNLALELPLADESAVRHLWDVDPASLEGRSVAMRAHCLACTAGNGSSCGGAMVAS